MPTETPHVEVHDSPSPMVAAESGFDVLEIFIVLARRWKLIAAFTIGFTLVGYALTYTLTTRYTATVTFLVEQDTASTGILLFRQSDPTLGLLQSKSIGELVVQRSGIQLPAKVKARIKDPADAMRALRGQVLAETDASKSTDNIYSVQVKDHEPARAVAIANAYLDALSALSNRMNFEGASETRSFYQGQMEAERSALEDSEAKLKAEQQRTGVLQPGSQTGLQFSQIATLRSQIVNLQVRRAELSQSATEDNPEIVRLEAQIAELQAKVNSLEGQIQSSNGKDIPSQNLEILRLEREVRYHEALLTSLASQFERARLQERFNVPRVRVIDRASLPVPQTWPKRFLMTLAAAVLGLFMGFVATGVLQIVTMLMRDPESSRKLRQIKQILLQRG